MIRMRMKIKREVVVKDEGGNRLNGKGQYKDVLQNLFSTVAFVRRGRPRERKVTSPTTHKLQMRRSSISAEAPQVEVRWGKLCLSGAHPREGS